LKGASRDSSPKDEEICEMAGWDPVRYPHKDKAFFESKMRKAMAEGRRVTSLEGLAVIVFAHKSTSGWEAQLQAIIDAGWVVTASWAIDTERGTPASRAELCRSCLFGASDLPPSRETE
jgi:putative DNA methylase